MTADQPLSASEFVQVVHDAVYVAAFRDAEELVAHPPGRNPGDDLIELSDWWNALKVSERELVRRVSVLTAGLTVFGFFCVLDNVRKVSDVHGLELRLHAVVNGVAHRVSDDETLNLHDIFSELVAQGPRP